MKLGDTVNCSAYIRPSKNYYERYETSACCFHTFGGDEGIEVEDFHSCERYKIIEKTFSGIFVGTTTRCTRLNAEAYCTSHQEGFRFYGDNPQKFAVVYYAKNKKRLVPIDRCCQKED